MLLQSYQLIDLQARVSSLGAPFYCVVTFFRSCKGASKSHYVFYEHSI